MVGDAGVRIVPIGIGNCDDLGVRVARPGNEMVAADHARPGNRNAEFGVCGHAISVELDLVLDRLIVEESVQVFEYSLHLGLECVERAGTDMRGQNGVAEPDQWR